jgi:hypothetical protein
MSQQLFNLHDVNADAPGWGSISSTSALRNEWWWSMAG